MKLIDDWQWVLKKAWSIKLILLAGFFSGLEAAMQIAMMLHWLDQYPIPPGILVAVSFFISNFAFAFRMIAQRKKPDGD